MELRITTRINHRTNDLWGGLFDRSGVTVVSAGDRFDRSDAGVRFPSSEKPSGTPGGRGGVRNCPGLWDTRGGGGIAAAASGATAEASGAGAGAARATGGGGGIAGASGIRALNASSSANLAA